MKAGDIIQCRFGSSPLPYRCEVLEVRDDSVLLERFITDSEHLVPNDQLLDVRIIETDRPTTRPRRKQPATPTPVDAWSRLAQAKSS